MYRALDEKRIIASVEKLRDRITQRFPESGLSRVSSELVAVAHDSVVETRYLARPNWPLRSAAGVLVVAIVGLLFAALASIRVSTRTEQWSDLLQGAEAGVNDIVFVAIAIYFLLSLERRLKRRRALAALHQLRSLAHVVDMHQVTKDPELSSNGPATGDETLPPADLVRYLDYCSDLLAISSKIGALFVQQFDDPVVLSAVDEIESLTTALSNKIWQKITLIERLR